MRINDDCQDTATHRENCNKEILSVFFRKAVLTTEDTTLQRENCEKEILSVSCVEKKAVVTTVQIQQYKKKTAKKKS